MRRVPKSRLNRLNSNTEPSITEVEEQLPATATNEDEDFVEELDNIITDENGNQFTVDEMLVVQNPDTLEISLFVPEDEEDSVPEDVTVIGEVKPSDDSVLNSSRRKLRVTSRRKY